MFSGYQVLQKCSYNQVTSIWVDRARQALQDGIVYFVFCDRLCLLPRRKGLFTYCESR